MTPEDQRLAEEAAIPVCEKGRLGKPLRILTFALAITSFALSGLAGYSYYYCLRVSKGSMTCWVERGNLIIVKRTPVALPWSPASAIDEARNRPLAELRAAILPVRDYYLEPHSEWDPSGDFRNGATLPHIRTLARELDSQAKCAWDRRQFIVPLWLALTLTAGPLVITQLRSRKFSSRSSFFDRLVRGAPRAALILVGLGSTALSAGAIAAFARQVPNENSKERAQKLETILALPNDGPVVRPEIQGSPRFCTVIQEALNLLKARDQNGYKLVCKYAPLIREGDSSGASLTEIPPRVDIKLLTIASRSPELRAATLVHEACHCKLAREAWRVGLEGFDASSKTLAELACIREEVSTMRRLGAPSWDIDALERQDGTHWERPHPW